ncbi:DUF669 domain-containing protein [Ruminococcus sp. OA3]|uniref:DUF669 domain-containing protein n=1 Tax=Ruminococcus sp. OA3 TaxID=2914164 RepID=UPI001F05937D|nr:DUF669 domain-containing protein [Ruminococcus sp. OA3]MCH1984184.1 DUF669 domain-containing protein [Ruminococcus sp. OA3]MCH1984573.1 DUF669 domain-containing protein [Ruminococcus sp. OA3]
MQKPNDYETTKPYGEYEALPAGGYVCRIVQVIETRSKKGKDMLQIALDIAEGEYQGKFQKEFSENTREDKKWPCTVYQLVLDAEGKTNRGLKTFLDAVEASNPGFRVIWGDTFCDNLRHRLVGGIFGREAYEKANGNGTGWSTKCQSFRETTAIREGRYQIPEDKPLKAGRQQWQPATDPDGFMSIPDGACEELPFN